MFRLRPHHFFEFSEPSLLAPLKAQVGLIYDRYTGISLNIRPTGGFREPSLRSAAPVLGETAPHVCSPGTAGAGILSLSFD
jgi:hypothetical protein